MRSAVSEWSSRCFRSRRSAAATTMIRTPAIPSITLTQRSRSIEVGAALFHQAAGDIFTRVREGRIAHVVQNHQSPAASAT
jgi:hypothetical protein